MLRERERERGGGGGRLVKAILFRDSGSFLFLLHTREMMVD